MSISMTGRNEVKRLTDDWTVPMMTATLRATLMKKMTTASETTEIMFMLIP